ncbi:UDP-N-acetylmuramoyl-L-alanine--D-glutamate ligase [bacterium]|nr:UDP-N-acetylmuramoyl-L-alanine--D-glutamate ligase [bacterium]
MKKTSDDLRNKRVTVMGLGSFGGGIGAARYLALRGARVTVTDLKTAENLGDSVKALDDLGVRFVLGRHEMNDFTGADIVVASPAVRRDSAYVTAARNAGAILTTELNLFVEQCPAPVCGVTGSNGKTTTVSMIQSILEQCEERFWIGGNIGGSLLSDIERIEPGDRVVLEISSFQLEWLDEMSWSPHIAAVLNVMPNHLDRHATFDDYRAAKAVILDHQTPDDCAILVSDDPGSASLRGHVKGKLIRIGTALEGDGVTLLDGWIVVRTGVQDRRILDTSKLLVPGRHNILNAMAATSCALELGVDDASIVRGLTAFRGVPHRIEFIGERSGVLFYNDSKATTPEAAAAAITSFDRPVIPILGGYDKGVSFGEMARRVSGHVLRAALIGVTAPMIARALEDAGVESDIYPTLGDAFDACVVRAGAGDIVVLTPGCASYDMFNNYVERGDAFRELVRHYIDGIS